MICLDCGNMDIQYDEKEKMMLNTTIMVHGFQKIMQKNLIGIMQRI